MSGELAGYRTIVTGGARGIGAVVARGFVEAGARVLILDKRDDLGGALVASLPADTARYRHCDVTDSAQVAAAFEEAARWMGGLDALVHSAGMDKPGYTPEDLPEEVFDLVLSVNAKGTYLTNQAAFRLMKEQGGAIINMGSLAGIRGMPDRPAYSAAKGAVLAWTRAVAIAWGRMPSPSTPSRRPWAPMSPNTIWRSLIPRNGASWRKTASACRRSAGGSARWSRTCCRWCACSRGRAGAT